MGLVHHGPKRANSPSGHVCRITTISSPVAVFSAFGNHWIHLENIELGEKDELL
jgi:hypothetical protein